MTRAIGLVAMATVVATSVLIAAMRRRLAVVAVFGPSMQPTLTAGDRVLVLRASISGVRPGQIVVFERPDEDGGWPTGPSVRPIGCREWMIKRVAAVPGEPVPETVWPAVAAIGGQSVPAGSLVVLGDNTANSKDSRAIGYIPADRVLGVMLHPLRIGR